MPNKIKNSKKKSNIAASVEGAGTQDNIYGRIYNAGMNLWKAGPWKEVDSDSWFLMRIPNREFPMAVSVMGSVGDGHGLTCILGEFAGDHMETMTWEGDRGIEVSLPMYMLSLVYEPLGNIPADYRTLYEKAKVSPEDSASVPFVYAKPPYEHSREANEEELEALLYVTTGLLEGWKLGTVDFDEMKNLESSLAFFSVAGEAVSPIVSKLPPTKIDELNEPGACPPLLLNPNRLANATKTDAEWIVATPVLPGSEEGSNEILRGLLIMDATSGLIVHTDIGNGKRAVQQFATIIVDLITEKLKPGSEHNDEEVKIGLPTAIDFSEDDLFDTVVHSFERGGIHCNLYQIPPAPMRDAINALVVEMGGMPKYDENDEIYDNAMDNFTPLTESNEDDQEDQ